MEGFWGGVISVTKHPFRNCLLLKLCFSSPAPHTRTEMGNGEQGEENTYLSKGQEEVTVAHALQQYSKKRKSGTCHQEEAI